jgi:hypothetical protein
MRRWESSMASKRLKTLGAVSGTLVLAFACSGPLLHMSRTPGAGEGQEAMDSVSNHSEATLEGYVSAPESCQGSTSRVVLSSASGDRSLHIETQTDAEGHFSIQAPAGHYNILIERGGCKRAEELNLAAASLHRFAFDMVPNRDDAEIEVGGRLLGGRVPASILLNSNE